MTRLFRALDHATQADYAEPPADCCEECGGTGERFWHTEDCDDDLPF